MTNNKIESIVDAEIKQGFASSKRGWVMSKILKKFKDAADRIYARTYIISITTGE